MRCASIGAHRRIGLLTGVGVAERSEMQAAKRSMRKELKRGIGALGERLRASKSETACGLLAVTAEFEQAGSVMLFLSIPNEIETAMVLNEALGNGKRVVVPSVVWETKRMIPVELKRLDCEMVTDRYGLRHPAAARPVLASEIDVVVVPGLGFDAIGNRLGRGGGFYDRFLTDTEFRGLACGLAFEEQVSQTVPCGDHDAKVGMLVTDKQVRRFDGD